MTNPKDYIDCVELIQRTGVSPAKGYAIIRQLNAKIKEISPDALIIPGKVSRAYYEGINFLSKDNQTSPRN